MARRSAAEAAETRDSLLASARDAFGNVGFAATSLDELSAAVGVTRGALHHHFGDKHQLFAEVFVQVIDEINAAVSAAVAVAPPLVQLRAGCEALFAKMADPAIRQIWLADAPAVLGIDRWYELDRAQGMLTIAAGLRTLFDEGFLAEELIEPVAILLYGAMTEAAIALATTDTAPSVDALISAMESMVAGLLTFE